MADKLVQVVTVLSTGKRYLLRHQTGVGTPGHKIHCWGEMVALNDSLGSKHEANGPVFLLTCGGVSGIEIKEEPKTRALMMELWAQMVMTMKERGHSVSVSRKGNVTIRRAR